MSRLQVQGGKEDEEGEQDEGTEEGEEEDGEVECRLVIGKYKVRISGLF